VKPEPDDEADDNEQDEANEENWFVSYRDPNQYVYGGLGWMSGTPGTIRNTGNPLNTFVGPFSNWPMPFQEGAGAYSYYSRSSSSSSLNTETFPWTKEALNQNNGEDEDMVMFSWDDLTTSGEENTDLMAEGDDQVVQDEVLEVEEIVPPSKPYPLKIWAKELPGQYKVGGYGSYHTGGANFVFGDGSLRFISNSVELTVLQNMGNRDSGQVIDGSL